MFMLRSLVERASVTKKIFGLLVPNACFVRDIFRRGAEYEGQQTGTLRSTACVFLIGCFLGAAYRQLVFEVVVY